MKAKLVLTLVFLVAMVAAGIWFMGGVSQAQHQVDLQVQQYASSSPR